jgi:hypothetical protein
MIESARRGGYVSRSSQLPVGVADRRWDEPAGGSCRLRSAPGDRLSALWRRFQEGGWSDLVDRPPVPKREPPRPSS